MNDKLKKKLKKKIWVISTIILLVYTVMLILNPTVLTTLLPIIIPTFILTVGLPGYAVSKYIRDVFKEKACGEIIEDDVIPFKHEKELCDEVVKSSDESIFLETNYELNTYQEDKPKIKTKGTIH